MLTRDAIKHLGSKAAVAKALGLTRGAVQFWGKVVPYASARQLCEKYPQIKLRESLYDERLRPKLDECRPS